MAIGNQITYSTASLNAELGQRTTDTHDVMAADREFFERISAFGLSGLQSIGFDAPTAQSFLQVAGYLNTIAQLWFGTVAQTPAFNFDDATAEAR